jgi:hypothetical protein
MIGRSHGVTAGQPPATARKFLFTHRGEIAMNEPSWVPLVVQRAADASAIGPDDSWEPSENAEILCIADADQLRPAEHHREPSKNKPIP